MKDKAEKARAASLTLAATEFNLRNTALRIAAEALQKAKVNLFDANRADRDDASEQGLAPPLLHRLIFDESKLSEVIRGLYALADLPDPIGRVTLSRELTPGLCLYRVTCPIGVIGVIFESRPDALVQIASLCVKTGNAALLKGGSEAKRTNRALFEVLGEAFLRAGLPQDTLGLMETRDEVGQMLGLDSLIDLIIPRGSNAFVREIMKNSRIPVLGHADGVCHVYVDALYDKETALRVVLDSKTHYAAVCNAAETLLVHTLSADSFIPYLKQSMDDAGVTLYGCRRTRGIIACPEADEAGWGREYLDLKMDVRVVDSLDEAIAHINRHGSGHTDAIVTTDNAAAEMFMTRVDSAGVFHNCSTRFSDGFRYGFGAEVGVATGKLHARGPVGPEGLTTYKYRLIGKGHTVGDMASGRASYTHKDL